MVTIGDKRKSLRLEASFWVGLDNIAKRRKASFQDMIALIDSRRGSVMLQSAIRVFVLNHHRSTVLRCVKRLPLSNPERYYI
jgi:predicted DNA-binding ribbon-helix-helix protein